MTLKFVDDKLYFPSDISEVAYDSSWGADEAFIIKSLIAGLNIKFMHPLVNRDTHGLFR